MNLPFTPLPHTYTLTYTYIQILTPPHAHTHPPTHPPHAHPPTHTHIHTQHTYMIVVACRQCEALKEGVEQLMIGQRLSSRRSTNLGRQSPVNSSSLSSRTADCGLLRHCSGMLLKNRIAEVYYDYASCNTLSEPTACSIPPWAVGPPPHVYSPFPRSPSSLTVS